MNGWETCKNILCIRADNMGDVIMTTPALRALKETFGAKITLLTSKAGSLITPCIKEVDHTVVYDLPWVASKTSGTGNELIHLCEHLQAFHFDAVVIFTVYSQSPLPAALLCVMAGIPKRLAYCRENPYGLLTEWIPDREPFDKILHQVERDLYLVKHVGAVSADESLSLSINAKAAQMVVEKLKKFHIQEEDAWLILHPGVSEEKRRYPAHLWIETGRLLYAKYRLPILITGSGAEHDLAEYIKNGIGDGAFNVSGTYSIEEFICLISKTRAVLSVNTSTIHIAAATQTPVAVLYAQTNPQHTPWKSPHVILPFSVKSKLQSKNVIIQFVSNMLYSKHIDYPEPVKVVEAINSII